MLGPGGEEPAILINRNLAGDPPELIASYVVQGTLLHEASEEDRITAPQATASLLLGALAYADLVTLDPALAAADTPGVVARNRDLLALLNSGPKAAGADALGFLGQAPGVDDVLRGLPADADCFADYVVARPQASDFGRRLARPAPPAFAAYLAFAGAAREAQRGEALFDLAALEALDAGLAAYLPPDELLVLAQALQLGVVGD